MAKADSTQPSEEHKKAAERRARKSRCNRERYLRNKETILAKNKAYREANREAISASRKAKKQVNREEITKARRERYAANKEHILKKNREWRRANREQLSARGRERYIQNREAILERRKPYRAKNSKRIQQRVAKWQRENKEKVRAWRAEYRKANPDRIRETKRKSIAKRRESDVAFRLVCLVRSRVSHALRKAASSKSCRTIEMLGCTGKELRLHVESKFLPGMTWENHGHAGWHIDHIIPLAKFDLSDPTQQAAAFHYTNLQPLWAKDNLRKSDKVAGQQCFGFAYAARIADAAAAKPQKRRGHGGKHGGH
jgi:hypothetical protein